MHYGRTTGTGARTDGGDLPTANYQKHQTCTVPMKYNYGRISVTGPTMKATRDDKGAYARALDNEITGVVTDLMKEVNRQLWGCGYGVLCRWLSGASTTQVVQKSYRGNAVGEDGFGSTFGAKYIKPNGNNSAVLHEGGSSGGSSFRSRPAEFYFPVRLRASRIKGAWYRVALL